jgi:TonB family protein
MVEEMPQFPGGIDALKTYVAASMKYPTIALENGIHGQVFVKFVVDKTGNITNAKISRGVDPSLDKEALRIVNSLPNWTPGKQNGEAVDVAYEMPVNFKMPADYRPKSHEKLRVTTDSYTKANKTLKLSIVPNPTSDNARVTLDGSGSTNKLEISVYDSSGKLIKNASKNGSTFSLSINKLPPGIYLVVGIDGENQLKVTSQLVVTH